MPVEKVVPQDEVTDTPNTSTTKAPYITSGDAEVKLSTREQSREKAALKFGAHQGALIVGDRLSCHAVREVGVGELIGRVQDVCAPQAAMPGGEVVDPVVVWVTGWIEVVQAQSPRHALEPLEALHDGARASVVEAHFPRRNPCAEGFEVNAA